MVVIAAAALTVVLGVFATRMEVSSSIEDLLPDEVRGFLREHGQSRDERDILLMAAASEHAFEVDALAALDQALQQIAARDEITESITPFNLMAFGKAANGGIVAGPVSPGGRAPADSEEAQILKRRLLEDPLSRKLLISPDGATLGAVFNVPLRNDYRHLFADLERISNVLSEHYDVRWAGNPTFEYRIRERLSADLPRLLVAVLAIIVISYFLMFRSIRAVVIPLLVVVMGTVWTIGTMSILGIRLTITSIMAPPLVLSLGSAYSVHVLSEYYAKVSAPVRTTVAMVMSRVTPTIVLASLTTIIGFSSLLTASLTQVREFGIITAIGIAFCALLVLFFVPACLRLLPAPGSMPRTGSDLRLLHRVLGLAETGWRYLVLAATALFAFVFLLVVGSLRYDTDVSHLFGRDSQVVQDNLFVVQRLVGLLDVNVTLSAPESAQGYFFDPGTLSLVADLEHTLREHPDIAYVSSFVTHLSRMNHAVRGTYQVPQNRAVVRVFFTLLDQFAAARSSALMVSDIDRDASRLTINIRVTEQQDGNGLVKEQEYRDRVERIREQVQHNIPEEMGVEIWSNGMAILSVSDDLRVDHLRSAIITVALVLLVTAIGFRSILLGALALIPAITGVMTNFTLMAVANIPLDAITMTLSALSIGVGVDYAIHLLLAFRRARREPGSDLPLSHVLADSARSVVISALSLTAGLLVLVTSTFPPIAIVGLLLAALVVSTLVGSLLILPAVLGLGRGRVPAR